MREQVIPRRSAIAAAVGKARGLAQRSQRPVRRDRAARRVIGARMRALFGYVPILLKVIMAIVIGVLIFAGYRAASCRELFSDSYG